MAEETSNDMVERLLDGPGDRLQEAKEQADNFFLRDGQWFAEEPETGRVIPVLPGLEVMAYHPAFNEWGRALIDDFTSNSIRVHYARDNTRFVFGAKPALRMLRMGISDTRESLPPAPLGTEDDGHQRYTISESRSELPLPVIEAQMIAHVLTDLSQLPPESRARIIEALQASIAAL